jgi:deoxyribodipyrimidine photo-lyase
MKTVHLYWSRRDFRLTDNPALSAALEAAHKHTEPFLPLFIIEDYMLRGDAELQFGYPQRYFLAQALPVFAKQFKDFLLLKGTAVQTLLQIQKTLVGNDLALQVYVNDDVHPDFYTQIEKLSAAGVSVQMFADQLTIQKELRTQTGNLYSVFTPYKKAAWKQFLNAPVLKQADPKTVEYADLNMFAEGFSKCEADTHAILSAASESRTFKVQSHVFDIDQLLESKINFSGWYFSEQEARHIFKQYLQHHLKDYADSRDSLEQDAETGGTSKMSLALTWGLISARDIRKQVQDHFGFDFESINWYAIPYSWHSPVHYLSELVWREFYKYIFFHNPKLMHEEFQPRFRGSIQWVEDSEAVLRFTAWVKGQTGYPIVDAAMQQLAQTGWMHNRARMIVASVLSKNLGVDWRWGQEYFRAQLIDLDEASNNGGWQWGASVGADPKPIRIFNPYLQAKNYDASGDYQKRWLGAGFDASAQAPIVEHTTARDEALVRYGLGKDSAARDF